MAVGVCIDPYITERQRTTKHAYKSFLIEFPPQQQLDMQNRPYYRRILIDDAVAAILRQTIGCNKIKITIDCFLNADLVSDVLNYPMYARRMGEARRNGIDMKLLTV